MKDRGKLNGQVNGPRELPAPPSTTFYKRAGRRIADAPDGGRLVFAVTVAMLLGVACGLWLSAQLASAAMESTPISSQSRSITNADSSEADVTKPASLNAEVAPAVIDNPTSPNAAGESDVEKEAVSKPTRALAENAEGGRAAGNKAARPAASEAEAPVETAVRKNAPSRGAASPCPIYTSASALTVRGGGEAALVLGGPGRQGRVSVTTPDWADIAVFSEGQAGGNRGWVKYSVRSVSKKAGVYSVRVNGPCGLMNIPVKVVR